MATVHSTDKRDAPSPSAGSWTMFIVTASCVAVLAGLVAWPSVEMSVVALCVPVYWLGRICQQAHRALRPDRPSAGQILPALVGSLGVLLVLWSVAASAVGMVAILMRCFGR